MTCAPRVNVRPQSYYYSPEIFLTMYDYWSQFHKLTLLLFEYENRQWQIGGCWTLESERIVSSQPLSRYPQDRSWKTAFCLRCRWLSLSVSPFTSRSFKEQNQSFILSFPISVAASVRLVWTWDSVREPLMRFEVCIQKIIVCISIWIYYLASLEAHKKHRHELSVEDHRFQLILHNY